MSTEPTLCICEFCSDGIKQEQITVKLHTLSWDTSEACSIGFPEVPKGTAPQMPMGTFCGDTDINGFLHFLVSRLPILPVFLGSSP